MEEAMRAPNQCYMDFRESTKSMDFCTWINLSTERVPLRLYTPLYMDLRVHTPCALSAVRDYSLTVVRDQ